MEKPWECKYCHVMMELIDQDHCRCPQCGVSVWEPIEKIDQEDEIVELMDSHTVSGARSFDSSLAGRRMGGGGRVRKKSRNRHRLTQQQLYNRLKKD